MASRRTTFRIAVVALALGAFALHAWKPTRNAPEPGAKPLVHADGGFTLGTLAFDRCELPAPHTTATTRAWCAPFQVAEDREHPDRRMIDLRLALVRSTAPLPERDLVVLIAGGPGQSAVESWPGVRGAFAPLLEHRNVLLLDQRGTGGSNALTCADAGGQDDLEDIGDERLAARTRACLAAVSRHADPRFYTTTIAVEDLEAVRQALGAPRFDLVGVSYGTRVAQQYAMRHPDGVRSIVLDSAVPNEQALGEEFAANLDTALQAQFAACKADAACAKAQGDPWANLLRVRDRLRESPVEVAYRDPVDWSPATMRLGADALAGLARMYAYAPETSALLPLALARAVEGDYTALAGQIRMLSRELASFADNAMQLSVICSEDADLIRVADSGDQTLLGTRLARAALDQCAVWPRGSRPDDFHVPFASALPTLLLVGELDPVTPPRYAEQIAKNLTNARVLVAKGQGHSVMGRGCLPRLVSRFIDRLDASALDAGCIADFAPTPAFIDYNGAAP